MRRGLLILLLLSMLFGLCACGKEAPPAPQPPVTEEEPVYSEKLEPAVDTPAPELPAEPEPEPAPAEPAAPETPAEPEPEPAPEPFVAPGKKKEVKNILLIGNSFSYYLVEELYGVASAAGYEINVCNLYKSSCTVQEHWTWLTDKEAGKGRYGFWVTNKDGRTKVLTDTTIDEALAYADWDVITLQQHFSPSIAGNRRSALDSCTPYVKNLFTYLKENFPKADLFWYETWAWDVGHGSIPSVGVQTNMYENIRDASIQLAEENGVPMIPCGDAFQLARANPVIGSSVCLAKDHAHDGDREGGQYINACVFFEAIFGESCVGNTWRPPYAYAEERNVAMQQVSHEAMLAVYGEDYFK